MMNGNYECIHNIILQCLISHGHNSLGLVLTISALVVTPFSTVTPVLSISKYRLRHWRPRSVHLFVDKQVVSYK